MHASGEKWYCKRCISGWSLVIFQLPLLAISFPEKSANTNERPAKIRGAYQPNIQKNRKVKAIKVM